MLVLAARPALVSLEGSASVGRAIHRRLHHVDHFGVARVGVGAAEVPTADDARVFRALRPSLARVVRAEEALIHDGVDAPVAGRDRAADAPAATGASTPS